MTAASEGFQSQCLERLQASSLFGADETLLHNVAGRDSDHKECVTVKWSRLP
jgi:hypothetical protein